MIFKRLDGITIYYEDLYGTQFSGDILEMDGDCIYLADEKSDREICLDISTNDSFEKCLKDAEMDYGDLAELVREERKAQL